MNKNKTIEKKEKKEGRG